MTELWEQQYYDAAAQEIASRTIQNLFREFNADRLEKDRLRPHDLRARTITLVATATLLIFLASTWHQIASFGVNG